MVGVVIKGADSAIYAEDTCAPVQYAYCTVQYTYCTLAHVHTSVVQYMEPCRWKSCSMVNSRKSNAILLEAACERSRCLLKVTKQLREHLPVQKSGTSQLDHTCSLGFIGNTLSDKPLAGMV